MDTDLRAIEREWRRAPSDDTLKRAALAFERAGQRPPADLGAQAIALRLKKKRVRLGPPLAERDVVVWERAHKVRLPEEYRQFLLHVGDGGQGPTFLWPLRPADFEEVDARDVKWARGAALKRSLGKPFPLTSAFSGLTNDDDLEDPRVMRLLAPLERGILTIGTDGCSRFYVLVVTGAAAGQIWLQDGPSILEPTASDYLSWYGAWLDHRARKQSAAAGKRKRRA